MVKSFSLVLFVFLLGCGGDSNNTDCRKYENVLIDDYYYKKRRVRIGEELINGEIFKVVTPNSVHCD